MKMMTRKHSIGWVITALFCGIFCIILVWYVDFEIITPMILPTDPCYYHTYPTPLWVELLYMHGGSNGHPEGNLTHFLVVIVLGAILGHLTVRAIRKNLARDPKDEKINKFD